MDSKTTSQPVLGLSPSKEMLGFTVPVFVLPAVVTCRSPIGARPSSPGAILGYTGGIFIYSIIIYICMTLKNNSFNESIIPS